MQARRFLSGLATGIGLLLSACAGKTILCGIPTAFAGGKIYDCPGYRLPTEAEWEYAYRAGSESVYYGGEKADVIGWYQQNGRSSSQPSKTKKANAWGIYDLAGNVWEWCHDLYQSSLGTAAVTDLAGPLTGDSRVTRGGSWRFGPAMVRAAKRLLHRPTNPYDAGGFRWVRTPMGRAAGRAEG